MHEGDPGRGELTIFRVDIIDLDREGDPGAGDDLALIEKDRQVGIVAHRGGLAVGDLEFDLETEMAPVPVARFLPVADRQRQVIETDHRAPPEFVPRALPVRCRPDKLLRPRNRGPAREPPMTEPSRIAHGGKTLYGARVGILMLETRFPRIPGDMGNGLTWPFPVLYKVVPGATPDRVVRHKSQGLANAFLDAAAELVQLGADGITTTCGFLSLYQRDLAAHVGVPVAASSLMQVPLVERLLPPGKRVGVLTVSAASLTREHLIAAGVDPEIPVVGTDQGREFSRVMLDEKHTLDAAAAEADILDAGDALLAQHPDIGAIVLECTNMTAFARALSDHLRLPVFSIYSFVTWFQAGLAPRDFGPPGSGPREWRER